MTKKKIFRNTKSLEICRIQPNPLSFTKKNIVGQYTSCNL